MFLFKKSLSSYLLRLSGTEWWNGTLEWNTGINNLIPKVHYVIKTHDSEPRGQEEAGCTR